LQTGNWIQTIEYGPAGSPSAHLLAVGTHGSSIVLLDSSANYALKSTITSHHAFLTHMDWSADGRVLRSNDGAYELLFHGVDPSSGAAHQITSAHSLRDTQWHSAHCPITALTAGAVPHTDGAFVNSMDVSSSSTAEANEQPLLAVAQDDGRVAVYNYPVPEGAHAQYHEYRGHSSHVSRPHKEQGKCGCTVVGLADCPFELQLT